METRANYVVIGLFTLAVVVGVFGFVYWFQNIGGTGERAFYRVQFEGSVSGLRTGGSVLFNGIRVGEVTGLALNPQRPEQVIATISIDKSVAIRPDTEIGLEFQGLTGIAALSLKGGTRSAPALVGSKENPPLLTASPGATTDVTQAARDVLRRLDDFLSENQKTFRSAVENIEKFSSALARNSEHIDSTLANVDRFSGVLARNSDRIDRIAAGLEGLTGGPDGKSGEINEAARAIRQLAENLDKRTAEITTGISRLSTTGARQIDALAADAHRTMSTIDRAVKNLDQNPSRLLWGGSGGGSNLPEYNKR
jgi:phospholipid/cholesterol/gamma-HCH transport system substrate-binding protein